MPTEQQHVDRARANESFARSLSTIEPIQAAWRVTAHFYAALHYVEAVLVRIGKPTTTHGQRRQALTVEREVRGVRAKYGTLEDTARAARYDPGANIAILRDLQQICDLSDEIRKSLGFS
ncbi:MAG TPA: hypothetical protein VGU66_16255 [Candidatus Elarobacter sp.]|nr:hypothetical protein [Candidatus Elarobacter sp.]